MTATQVIDSTRTATGTRLALLSPGTPVDVTLYWQQWRQGSAALTGVADAIRTAARVLH